MGWGIIHLAVAALHMRHIGVPFRKPLVTIPTRPATGFGTVSAPVGLFPGTDRVFPKAVSIFFLDGHVILVLSTPDYLLLSLFDITYMDTLYPRNVRKTIPRFNKKIDVKVFSSSFMQQLKASLNCLV